MLTSEASILIDAFQRWIQRARDEADDIGHGCATATKGGVDPLLSDTITITSLGPQLTPGFDLSPVESAYLMLKRWHEAGSSLRPSAAEINESLERALFRVVAARDSLLQRLVEQQRSASSAGGVADGSRPAAADRPPIEEVRKSLAAWKESVASQLAEFKLLNREGSTFVDSEKWKQLDDALSPTAAARYVAAKFGVEDKHGVERIRKLFNKRSDPWWSKFEDEKNGA